MNGFLIKKSLNETSFLANDVILQYKHNKISIAYPINYNLQYENILQNQ